VVSSQWSVVSGQWSVVTDYMNVGPVSATDYTYY